MAWTSLKITGLVIGLLLFCLAILTTILLYLRHKRKSKPALEKPTDIESQAPTTPNPDLTSSTVNDADFELPSSAPPPSPAHSTQASSITDLHDHFPSPVTVEEPEPATVRRTTGHPQLFTDWVTHTNDNASTPRTAEKTRAPRHSPFPSLSGHSSEISVPYLPGPTTASTEAASLMESLPRVSRVGVTARPGTRDSFGATSLRRAVLGAAEVTRAGVFEKENAGVEEEVEMEVEKEMVKRSEGVVGDGAARGYSGAWP